MTLYHIKKSFYSFRYDNLVDLPRVRTTRYGKSTFCYEAAEVWNSLPNELRKVEDFGEFRRLVHTCGGSSYKCSMCKFSKKKKNSFSFPFCSFSFVLLLLFCFSCSFICFTLQFAYIFQSACCSFYYYSASASSTQSLSYI